jgi:signal transduction histidine kinase/CheY-like chemotaxis protein
MVSDWIWETDEELRLTFLSHGAAATFLEAYDSMLGKSWNELPISYVHIDDSVGYLSQMRNRHAFRDALLRFDLPRGDHRYIKLSGKPLFDETGGFRGYRGAGANATAEYLARNEVRLLKDRLHDAVESLFESFALYDADDRLVLANQRRFDQHPAVPQLGTPGALFEDAVTAMAAQGLYASLGPSATERSTARDGIEQEIDSAAMLRARRAGLTEDQARLVGRRLWLHRHAPCQHLIQYSTGHWIQVRENRTREGGWVVTHTDITDTVEQQQQLAQKTTFLQTTLDTINAGIRVLDEEWRLIAWNQQYVRLFDLSPDMMWTGRPLIELFRDGARRGLLGPGDPETLALGEMEKVKSRAKGAPVPYEYNGRRFEIVRNTLPDGSDFAAATDVTEGFERQRQLEERTALLQTVFDTISEGIWVYDKDWHLLFWNDRYAQTWSIPREMLYPGVPLMDLCRQWAKQQGANPEDTEKLAERRFREITDRRPGQTYRYEINAGRTLETRQFDMPSGGHLGTITDITEMVERQKQLAEKTALLQTTLDSISQGLRVYDRDWKLVVWNRHYARLAGFSEELLQVGTPLIELQRDAARRGALGPGDPEALAQELVDFIRNAPNAVPTRRSQGDGRILEFLSVKMRDGSNFGTITDVTEQLEAESERERLEEQLRHKLKMEAIGTLAGGIAHDFNNILSAIIGYSELALGNLPEDSRPAGHVREILTAGTRAKALTSQILAFSRRREGERKPVRLLPILTDAMRLIRASVASTVELRSTVTDPSLVVLADSTQLHQVAMNLCTNAWQAMPHGGVLELGLDRVDAKEPLVLGKSTLPAGHYARMWVADSGHGIEPKAIDRIFDPFFTTKNAQGTGLGLSVVYGIVARHGGGIDVHSVPSKGTRFDVYIPLSDQPAIESENVAALRRGRGQTIMLVDDEETLVTLGEEMLADLAYEPVGYSRATTALAAFRDNPHRFDLVILDQMMPQMTGTELAEEIARIRSDIPIVLLTGYEDAALEGRVGVERIRRILLKPLAREELASCLAQMLPDAPEPKGPASSRKDVRTAPPAARRYSRPRARS